MLVITATKARSNLFQLLKKVIKEEFPTKISSKDGNVVIMSEEYYESMLETAELLAEEGLLESIKEAREELKRGEVYSIEDVFGKNEI